jgi:hypothetical protein
MAMRAARLRKWPTPAPAAPATAKFRTPGSRGWAIARIERDPPPSVQQAGGGSDDADAAAVYDAGVAAEAAANDEAALAASQAATQMTNDGIAQTVQGINGP